MCIFATQTDDCDCRQCKRDKVKAELRAASTEEKQGFLSRCAVINPTLEETQQQVNNAVRQRADEAYITGFNAGYADAFKRMKRALEDLQ